jgi:hypothetical protein
MKKPGSYWDSDSRNPPNQVKLIASLGALSLCVSQAVRVS